MTDQTNTQVSASQTEETLARIGVDILFGKLVLPHQRDSFIYLQKFQKIGNQLRKLFGKDYVLAVQETFRPALHVAADMIFDRVCDLEIRDETKGKLKALPVTHRLLVEHLVGRMTGRTSAQGEREAHWMDGLWQARKLVREVVASSISIESAEEIRTGFDGLMHQVLDKLFDNRDLLLN